MEVKDMLIDSRYKANASQDYMARKLNVSRRTILNWETGYSVPDFNTIIKWFDVLSVPMYPYLMSMLHPKEVEGITKDTDMDKLRTALHAHIDELDDLRVRELLYILYGSHNLSPTGVLDMITAYLHTPMAMRVAISNNIICNYEIAEAVGMIDNDHILPQTETLKRYLKSAKQAVMSGKETYIIKESD